VLEGERKLSRDNNLLGNFELSGIAPAPRGVPKIDISFELDANGILNITAEDKASGKKNSITITNDAKRLSKDEIERLVKEAESFKEQDDKVKERIEAKNGLENYCYNVRNSLTDLKDKLKAEDRETLEKKVKETLDWLNGHADAEKTEYDEKQKELEGIMFPIMKNVYGQGMDGGQAGSQADSNSSTHSAPRVEEVD